jgi:hypothetical protein
MRCRRRRKVVSIRNRRLRRRGREERHTMSEEVRRIMGRNRIQDREDSRLTLNDSVRQKQEGGFD